MDRMAIPTGLYVAIPQGYEIQIRPRSGMALKNGITCLNTPGTIDSDYRGEIKVILINLSKDSQKIVNGDRIAQMVLQKVETLQWQPTETLSATERGIGGFGSSGSN
jgi:dUTP pyrophosphatase